MTDPRNQSRPAKPATCACYVVGCASSAFCARAVLAVSRKVPHFGDIHECPVDLEDTLMEVLDSSVCPHWVGVEA